MHLKVAFLSCRSHGDSAVITFTDKGKRACIVVDGGEDSNSAAALAEYLKSAQVKTINLMVGTHIDSDHINGLKYFVQGELTKKRAGRPCVNVLQFWGPMPSETLVPDVKPASGPKTKEPGLGVTWQQYMIQSVQQNDDLFGALQELGTKIHHPAVDNVPAMPFHDVKIDLLGPDTQIPADHIKNKALGLTDRASTGKAISTLEDLEAAVTLNYEQLSIEANRDANNQSIVFRLEPAVGVARAKSWRFLFTGDAEDEAWAEMLGNAKVASRLPARVLKIPHHGSALNGITPAGAKKVKPKYSLNSVGQKHGLPDAGTLKLLRTAGQAILCTQRNDDSKQPSACRGIPASECPAKGKPQNVCFSLDTATGTCEITPKNRACGHGW
jgi:hypothetical protein